MAESARKLKKPLISASTTHWVRSFMIALSYSTQRVVGTSTRPKSVRAIPKFGFPNHLQNLAQPVLDQSVLKTWNPKRTPPRHTLRNVHPSSRLGSVSQPTQAAGNGVYSHSGLLRFFSDKRNASSKGTQHDSSRVLRSTGVTPQRIFLFTSTCCTKRNDYSHNR
jgi:hypothetical protein